jgi:hypothetical protein
MSQTGAVVCKFSIACVSMQRWLFYIIWCTVPHSRELTFPTNCSYSVSTCLACLLHVCYSKMQKSLNESPERERHCPGPKALFFLPLVLSPQVFVVNFVKNFFTLISEKKAYKHRTMVHCSLFSAVAGVLNAVQRLL